MDGMKASDIVISLAFLAVTWVVFTGSVIADPGAAESYDRSEMTGPIAVWIGREGSGLPPAVLERVESRVRIPMAAGVESLSAGAAAAVLLYEANRQRRGSRAIARGGG